MRPPWTVNCAAEYLAIQAFGRYTELAQSREYIQRERELMEKALSGFGFTVHPSAANYILFDTGVPVGKLVDLLLKEGFIVRDCTSFGLPTSIRISVREHDENCALLEALSGCLP
jgi:threonine-phosphate decarboxylase